MKEYTSIEKEIRYGEIVYAFDKIDGSNIRAEWNKKSKLSKFGTRHQSIGAKDSGIWGEAIQLIVEKYERDLHDIFVDQRWQTVTCFFEFWGKNSFAGNHIEEPHDVTLFDVSIYKKGYVLPREYLKLFKNVDIAKLLYYGEVNQEFIDSVKQSQLEGMTFEGVVCKMARYKTPGITDMFKVKSSVWLDKLKIKCNGDKRLFEQLA